MTFLEGQIVERQALITLYQTRILSGVYKNRKVYHGVNFKHPFTDEEKLDDEINILEKHVEILHRLVEQLNNK
jgi:hypothetical protein